MSIRPPAGFQGVGGPWQKLKTGLWVGPPASVPTTGTQGSQNRLQVTPLFIGNSGTLDRIACEVTAVAASSTVRMGVYADNGAHYPGSLLVETTAIDTSTGVEVKQATIALTVATGLYWLAVVSQGGLATLSCMRGHLAPVQATAAAGAIGSGAAYAHNSYYQDGVTAALPATFTSTVGTVGSSPRVVVRAA